MGLVENTLTGNLILTVMLAFAEYERGHDRGAYPDRQGGCQTGSQLPGGQAEEVYCLSVAACN